MFSYGMAMALDVVLSENINLTENYIRGQFTVPASMLFIGGIYGYFTNADLYLYVY